MNKMKEVFLAQYQLTRDARSVLIEYCKSISQENFIRSHPDVGNGGSIRNLLVHINNSYHGWMKKFAFQEPFQKRAYTDLTTIGDCERYFHETDDLVMQFLDRYHDRYDQSLTGELASRTFSTTPVQLFTHVVTNEFHHKGQILVIGRAWGYEPVDTDVLR